MNPILLWLFLIMMPSFSPAAGLDDDRGVSLFLSSAREYAENTLGACAAHRHLADAALPLRPSAKSCPRALVMFDQTQTLQREAANHCEDLTRTTDRNFVDRSVCSAHTPPSQDRLYREIKKARDQARYLHEVIDVDSLTPADESALDSGKGDSEFARSECAKVIFYAFTARKLHTTWLNRIFSYAEMAAEESCAGPGQDREAYEIALRDGVERAQKFLDAREAEYKSQSRPPDRPQEMH